jgi:hypothetical protein
MHDALDKLPQLILSRVTEEKLASQKIKLSKRQLSKRRSALRRKPAFRNPDCAMRNPCYDPIG